MIRALSSALFCIAMQAAASSPPEPSVDPVAQLLVQRLAESDSPACIAVGVVRAGRSSISFGCSADAGPASFDRDSLFEIGSITKGLTGLLLADMVRKGEVKLDDPASKHSRPGATLPRYGDREITLGDLVTHTSGLPRLPPGFAPKDWRNPYADYDADKLYAALAATRLDLESGFGHAYSNFGFMWLSEILSRAGGKPYDVLLTERVLVPLDMASSFVVVPPDREARRVVGHDVAYRPVSPWDNARELAGVGGVRSSIGDMVKLAQALSGARSTPLDATIALALEPLRRLGDVESRIGYGWIRHDSGKRRTYWHNGGTGGFSSNLVFDREAKSAAVVLADSVARFDDLARHLVDDSRPLGGRAPFTAPLDPAVAREYLGVYELTPSFAIEVFAAGRRLFGQATNQPPLEIRERSKDLFSVIGVDAQLRFERGPGGAIERVVLIQGGREQPGARRR